LATVYETVFVWVFGTSTVQVSASGASTALESAWVDLTALARADVYLAIVGQNGDGVLDRIFCFGGRSVSLWRVKADGSIEQAWDSGSEIERRTAEQMPACFNSDGERGGGADDRSDSRGPEPEGVEGVEEWVEEVEQRPA